MIEELISSESALKQYGVVLNADKGVDEAATMALRKKLRSKRLRPPAQAAAV